MWGSSFLFTKIAVTAVPPTTVVAARLVIGAAVLVPGVLLAGRRMPRPGRMWMWFAALAVVGNALPFWLISWGQQRIDSGLAGILMAVMPLATVLLAHWFVEGERLTGPKIVGFVVGFAGVVVLIGPEALLTLGGSGSALVAQLAVLGGAVCYACNAILARRRPASDPLVAAAGMTLVAAVLMTPMAAVVEDVPSNLNLSAGAGLAIAYLGAVATAAATVVFFVLVTAAGPSFMSLINYLIPVWAVGLGMAVLDERPAISAVGALALVLGGIALTEWRRPPSAAVPPSDKA